METLGHEHRRQSNVEPVMFKRIRNVLLLTWSMIKTAKQIDTYIDMPLRSGALATLRAKC